MNDLSRRNLESPRNLERLESSFSPMTTLTLSAGLRDAELETDSPVLAVEPSSDVPVEQPVEKMDDHSLLAATLTGDEAAL